MLEWNVDPVLFHLGPLQIRWYGLLFAIALMGAFYIWRWQALRGGYTEKQADRLLTLAVLATIIGARLGHVFFYDAARYLKDPITILYVWKGGLASHGATIGLIVTLAYFAISEKIRILEVMDRFAMSVTWAVICVRTGNFVNSEIVGRQTDGTFGVKFPRYDHHLALAEVPLRHPGQLYEGLLGLGVLAALYMIDRRLGERRSLGLMTFTLFTLYFGGRIFVEQFKEYQTLDAATSALTMGQYLSIPLALTGLIGLVWALRRRVPGSAAAA